MCDADVDDSDTMNKKIRNAQLAQYNFIMGKILNCNFVFVYPPLNLAAVFYFLFLFSLCQLLVRRSSVETL